MSTNVTAWIRLCPICQVTKSSTTKPAGLLQTLPVPNRIWEDLKMDFIVWLPLSSGYTNILVVVDRLTKGTHFIPLLSPMTAPIVARAFSKNVIKHHGVPRSIVSTGIASSSTTFGRKSSSCKGPCSSIPSPTTNKRTTNRRWSIDAYSNTSSVSPCPSHHNGRTSSTLRNSGMIHHTTQP